MAYHQLIFEPTFLHKYQSNWIFTGNFPKSILKTVEAILPKKKPENCEAIITISYSITFINKTNQRKKLWKSLGLHQVFQPYATKFIKFNWLTLNLGKDWLKSSKGFVFKHLIIFAGVSSGHPTSFACFFATSNWLNANGITPVGDPLIAIALWNNPVKYLNKKYFLMPSQLSVISCFGKFEIQ